MNKRNRRATIISLHLQGDSPATIIRKLNLSRNQRATVYNVVNLFKKRGTFEMQKRANSRQSMARKKAANNIRGKIRRTVFVLKEDWLVSMDYH